MKKAFKVRKVRWDPIVAKLAENGTKPNFCAPTRKQHKTSTNKPNKPNKVNKANVPMKRRTKEEFEAYLKSLFADDNLQFKYQTPDAWVFPEPEKKKKKWRF